MRGVYFNKSTRKWRVKHKGKYIGSFSSQDEAIQIKNELNDQSYYEKQKNDIGKIFGVYKVIGLTDESVLDKGKYLVPIYVCQNLLTGEFKTIRRDSLNNGSATGMNTRAAKKAYKNKGGFFYNSRITILGTDYYLGSFINEKDAENAYDQAFDDFLKKGIRPVKVSRMPASDAKIVNYLLKGILKGVSYVKSRNKWKATLMFEGVFVLNKCFDTKEEAIAARLAAEEKYFKPILKKYENQKEND